MVGFKLEALDELEKILCKINVYKSGEPLYCIRSHHLVAKVASKKFKITLRLRKPPYGHEPIGLGSFFRHVPLHDAQKFGQERALTRTAVAMPPNPLRKVAVPQSAYSVG